jgi:hypothetical protein
MNHRRLRVPDHPLSRMMTTERYFTTAVGSENTGRHKGASNPEKLFIGANRAASLDQAAAAALSRVIRRLAPWE